MKTRKPLDADFRVYFLPLSSLRPLPSAESGRFQEYLAARLGVIQLS
ncbi:MAG: hypothetical protein NW226_16645 [Microscillaceae bacterium]|nr:hypothetical protein [Microscillaceae bacterium]